MRSNAYICGAMHTFVDSLIEARLQGDVCRHFSCQRSARQTKLDITANPHVTVQSDSHCPCLQTEISKVAT